MKLWTVFLLAVVFIACTDTTPRLSKSGSNGQSGTVVDFTKHDFWDELNAARQASLVPDEERVLKFLFRTLSKPTDEMEALGLASVAPLVNPGEQVLVEQTVSALHKQFFQKVKTGTSYGPVSGIKEKYGQSPDERIGLSSGGYYRLFVAYWTLKIKVDALMDGNRKQHGYAYYCNLDAIIGDVEANLASAFFPSPGPAQLSLEQRREGVNQMLLLFAPGTSISELYEGADAQKVGWPILK